MTGIPDSKQRKVVYTIVKRGRDQETFWIRIGAAFVNRDGSLNVFLDAVPTNGQLHIRDPKPVAARPLAEDPFAEALAS
jgi:hypothetical protein